MWVRQKQQRHHEAEKHGAEAAEERALRDIAGDGSVRGGRVLRDAQNVYQAGFDVPAADAERAAPGDAAAQQQANTALAALQAELDAAYARWEALGG